jgi:hypothetical protein
MIIHSSFLGHKNPSWDGFLDLLESNMTGTCKKLSWKKLTTTIPEGLTYYRIKTLYNVI